MKRAVAVVVLVWAVSTLLWLAPGVLIPDGAGYFAYLPSTWIDHDLLFFNEWQRFRMIRGGTILFKDVTSTDHLGNHWTSGPALAWYPAYVMGDSLRVFTRAPGNGISLPYNVPVVATSALAGLLTLLLGFYAASRFGARNAAMAAIGVWLGSPLMWYSLRHATMSHAIGAAACAAVVVLSLRLREGVDAEMLFSVGLAIGFAFAVRPQNAPFALVPFLVAPVPWRRIGWLALGGLIGILPQIVVGQVLYGSPLAFANVGGSGNDWQSFAHVRLFETIFSSYHGLAVWTPLLIVAIAGFVPLVRADRRLGIAAIVCFAAEWVMNSTLDRAFWGGAAFGQRRFDNCTIFFLLGLAALFARLPVWLAAIVEAVPCAWTMSLFCADLDLNFYQSPRELLAAATWPRLMPLAFVPREAKVAVFAFVVATFALFAGLTVIAYKLTPRMRAIAAAAYFAAFAAFFAWCGAHDDPRPYAALIARNRAHPTGIAATSLLVIENEIRWLERIGRAEEAGRARAEAEALRKRVAPMLSSPAAHAPAREKGDRGPAGVQR